MIWRKKKKEPEVKRKIDYIPMLKNVFEEKAYAEYAGGTLCYQEQLYTDAGVPISGGHELHLLSFSKEDLTKEEEYWLALCYVKYKNGSLIDKAWDIIKSYDGRSAKDLLCSI